MFPIIVHRYAEYCRQRDAAQTEDEALRARDEAVAQMREARPYSAPGGGECTYI